MTQTGVCVRDEVECRFASSEKGVEDNLLAGVGACLLQFWVARKRFGGLGGCREIDVRLGVGVVERDGCGGREKKKKKRGECRITEK